MKPRLLDLFCGAGGAAMGYSRAGFEVTGVDIVFQPHYPFEFILSEAFDVAMWGKRYDAIHASPPCQAYSNAQRIRNNEHPQYIQRVREQLQAIGLPYVIENVPGAPLRNPIELCGRMFHLQIYRHRIFETSFAVEQPAHAKHIVKNAKMGRRPKDDEYMHVVGNFSDVARARGAMGTPWMTRDEMKEAIPPAYTEHIGLALLEALR